MKVDIDPKAILQKETDSRGRFTLGSEWANQEVKLLVVEDENDE